jgi:crotonobetainyl-CoA:carnitine CoA-transferase CaiB-like acyl-CoA transferase
VLAHPQVQANGVLVELDHPGAGRVRQARAAARFEATPNEMRLGAPRLGEHTREVLREAGYADEAIEGLLRDGIVAAG